MDRLVIPFIDSDEIVSYLKGQAKPCLIECLNWPDFACRPDVEFSSAHDGNNLWVLFSVKESSFRAVVNETNGPVYTDSCVEIFLSPERDAYYYNLEFNAIGTVLAGYGKGRERQWIDPAVLSGIQSVTSLEKFPVQPVRQEVSWELLLKIPKSVFVHSSIDGFRGLKMSGNFYKCGDLTPEPHYLSYWPVKTGKPDFHRCEYFGGIEFGE